MRTRVPRRCSDNDAAVVVSRSIPESDDIEDNEEN